jgi:hypothetical protein
MDITEKVGLCESHVHKKNNSGKHVPQVAVALCNGYYCAEKLDKQHFPAWLVEQTLRCLDLGNGIASRLQRFGAVLFFNCYLVQQCTLPSTVICNQPLA